MKVLILAAGVGTRFSRNLKELPKCCASVDGRPLICHTVELLQRAGLNEIAIVTGYEEGKIFKALAEYKVHAFRNPFYRVTNSVASMWFAQAWFNGDDDHLILNGDLFIEDNALKRLLDVDKSPLFLADSTRIADADYRFQWNGDRLLRAGKELSDNETTGEYVGIAKIKAKDVQNMKERLDDIVDRGDFNMWWEDVFYSFLNDECSPIYIEDIGGLFWAEIDFIEDYRRVQTYVKTDRC